MAESAAVAIGGVHTHGRSHHAAVNDEAGRALGFIEFEVGAAGCRKHPL